jgi:uncharacterized membrane protein YhhN
MSITTILIAIIIVSGLMHIKTEYYGPEKQKYIFKPLTTLSILILAGIQTTTNPDSHFYQLMIMAGLFFSLWGDIYLMLPRDRFIQGLISFLIAHIFYIIAFSIDVPQMVPVNYLIPFLIYGFIMFRILSPDMGKLRIPVMVYIAVIMTMVFMAMNRFFIIHDLYSIFAFCGAILFMISDTILAINKFLFQTKVSKALLFLDTGPNKEIPRVKSKFVLAQLLILTTYYSAQVFIALSVH